LLLFLKLIILKIEKIDLENSKYLKFIYSTRFSYEEFIEHDKSKCEDYLIYFLVKLMEGLCE
jgi:hypothetical protein